MDGRGRATDNIAIERFWGTLKRAEVYLSEYHTAIDAYRGISRYIKKYNSERPHTSNGDLTLRKYSRNCRKNYYVRCYRFKCYNNKKFFKEVFC
jgi:transposase InsO family protein